MQFWNVVVKEHILRGACSSHFELNGNPDFPKDRLWPVLEIPIWDCVSARVGTSPFHFYFSILWGGTFLFSSGTVIWKVKGSFCYGLSKILATPVTWHSKEIFAMFRNARCSLCQPKLLPGVFTTKWAAQSLVSAPEIPGDSSEVSVLASLSFSM